MKNLLFLTTILTSIFSTAQENFILKKDGTKIEIQVEDYYYGNFGKAIYTSADKDGSVFEQGIKLNEIEKLVSGLITYIPFKKSENKKDKLILYKVVAESNSKMLLVAFTEPRTKDDYYFIYDYRIVDKLTNTIIVSDVFYESGMPKKLVWQKDAIAAIKIHFSDCKNIIDNLIEFEKNMPTSNGRGISDIYIAGFMHQKKPLTCN
jgi:hypothetical protein